MKTNLLALLTACALLIIAAHAQDAYVPGSFSVGTNILAPSATIGTLNATTANVARFSANVVTAMTVYAQAASATVVRSSYNLANVLYADSSEELDPLYYLSNIDDYNGYAFWFNTLLPFAALNAVSDLPRRDYTVRLGVRSYWGTGINGIVITISPLTGDYIRVYAITNNAISKDLSIYPRLRYVDAITPLVLSVTNALSPTSAPIPYTFAVYGTSIYFCVTNSWVGNGTNWVRLAIDGTW